MGIDVNPEFRLESESEFLFRKSFSISLHRIQFFCSILSFCCHDHIQEVAKR